MKTFLNNQPNSGFTLIELLVVISIVGFLSSVILGQVNEGRARADATQVLQEFKEIEKAMILLHDDQGYANWMNERDIIGNDWNVDNPEISRLSSNTSGLGKFLKNTAHSPIPNATFRYDNDYHKHESSYPLLKDQFDQDEHQEELDAYPEGVNLFFQHTAPEELYNLYLILNKQIDKNDPSSQNNSSISTRKYGKIRFYTDNVTTHILIYTISNRADLY